MTYDKVKLKEQLEKLECVKKENQTAPEDAYVAYKEKEKAAKEAERARKRQNKK